MSRKSDNAAHGGLFSTWNKTADEQVVFDGEIEKLHGHNILYGVVATAAEHTCWNANVKTIIILTCIGRWGLIGRHDDELFSGTAPRSRGPEPTKRKKTDRSRQTERRRSPRLLLGGRTARSARKRLAKKVLLYTAGASGLRRTKTIQSVSSYENARAPCRIWTANTRRRAIGSSVRLSVQKCHFPVYLPTITYFK